jgi:hypothetical protein
MDIFQPPEYRFLFRATMQSVANGYPRSLRLDSRRVWYVRYRTDLGAGGVSTYLINGYSEKRHGEIDVATQAEPREPFINSMSISRNFIDEDYLLINLAYIGDTQ